MTRSQQRIGAFVAYAIGVQLFLEILLVALFGWIYYKS